MNELLTRRFKRIHMVGIGGSGMSGIAEILLYSGFRISGCDLVDNESTQRLRNLGAEVGKGHSTEHVRSADAVIYSSAVAADHPELVEAVRRRIPVIRRAEMLAELMRMKVGVAISGTHGKTTTTSLVGEVLSAGGLEPTVLVGGRLKRLGGGAVSGGGEFLVAEADEYDQSFLRLTPTVVVVTNVDPDHLECYGSFAALEDAFVRFANSVPFYGRTVVCADEPSIGKILPRLERGVVTYGLSPSADLGAENVEFKGSATTFEAFDRRAHSRATRVRVHLPLPGRHNVLNALAAATVGVELGIGWEAIKSALEGFRGVHRRFEILGEAGGVMVVDDFAHHPTEISATLTAARSGWERRIITVFQPHLFSRTRDMAEEFGKALLGADVAYVLPIYPAREQPLPGVTSGLIVDAAVRQGHRQVYSVADRPMAVDMVKAAVRPGDMVIVMGAGDVYRLGPVILELLHNA